MSILLFLLASIFVWKILRVVSRKLVNSNILVRFLYIIFVMYIASEYFYLAKYHQFAFLFEKIMPNDVNNVFCWWFSFIFSVLLVSTCFPMSIAKSKNNL